MATQAFGKYQTTQLLGRGGMAEVYAGTHPDLGRRVAIKVILPQLAEAAGFEERFRREARLVASLRHPHIVQLYDFDFVEGRAFMVMEYLEGGALADRLQAARSRGEIMPLGEAARILDAISDALDYAHRQGVVHRDIKPGNILFTADNQPVLSDFGIAHLQAGAARLTATGGIIGSPAYMSPEQATGQAVDARSDIYSLGVVLFEMATGRVPFLAETPTAVLLRHVQEPPPPPSDLNPNLPQPAAAVILKALAKDPAARFGSAGELASAWRAGLRGEAPASQPAPDSAAATLADGDLGAIASPPPPPAGSVPPPAAPSPPSPGWLTRVLQAADLVAPLVGKTPGEIRPAGRDRRARLAALMGAIAIFVAFVNFVNDIFGLINVGNLPLARLGPFLVAALLLVGAGLAVYTLRHAASRRRRAQAVLLLASMLLLTLVWGGWTAYQRLRPASEFLVTVNQFDGSQASIKLDIARTIAEGLEIELEELDETIAVERTAEPLADDQEARQLGQRHKSTLVIWGWYDDKRFRSFVELLKLPDLRQSATVVRVLGNTVAGALAPSGASSSGQMAAISHYTRTPAQLSRLDFELDNASGQMNYVSAAILGLAMFGNGRNDVALALFDKALANADAGAAPVFSLDKVYFHRAVTLMALGRNQEAVADLEQAVEIKPDLYEAHHNLAIAYAQTCSPTLQLDRAIAAAETAARLRPDEAAAHRLLGDLYHQAGRDDEAEQSVLAALERQPDDAVAQRLLGDVYTALGQTDAAAKSYDRALALLPASPNGEATVAVQRGDALVSAGRYAEALAAYESARTADPTQTEPLRGLGNAYFWQGEVEKAAAAYQTWAEMAPEDYEAPLLIGLAYANSARPDQAIPALEAASRLAEEKAICDPAPLLVLAGLYWQQNDYDRAIATYQKALAIDPANADVHYILGRTYLLQERLEEAIAALRQAVALRPDDVQSLEALGQSYLAEAAWAEALAVYQHLAELRPQEASVYLAMGDAYSRLGRLEDAAAAYQRATELEASANAFTLLGLMKVQLGDIDGATASYRQALALDPNHAAAHQSLGNAYQMQGNPAEAAAEYRTAIALAETAFLQIQLGTVLGRLGRGDEALAALARALELDPQAAEAYNQIGLIYANQGDLAQAEAAYRAAIDLDDAVPLYHFGLAQMAYRQCSLSAAVQAQNRAVALAPDANDYKTFLAALYEAQGRVAEAQTLYDALAQAPDADLFAHSAAGDYLLRQERYEAAAEQFGRLVEGEAASALAAYYGHYGLGRVFLRQDKLLPARAEFELALAALPRLAFDPQVAIGDISLREGDVAAALATYEAAAALLPAYQAVNTAETGAWAEVGLEVRRGIVFDRLGEATTAGAARDRALSLAQAVVAAAPRSPLGHLALGLAHQARGENDLAEQSYAIAAQCDQTLAGVRELIEVYLQTLR